MPKSPLVLKLLCHLESCGLREEIVGDLVEEIARGRSPAWVCRQLVPLCGLTLVDQVRQRASTPRGIALMLGGTALGALSVVPAGRVVEAWLVLYCVSGTASLFAHMATAELPTSHRQTDKQVVLG